MFLAVAYGRETGGSVSLDDVIGTADAINHAIPLDTELMDGLNRLIAARLVSDTEDSFALTPAGEALHAKVRKRAGQWKQFDRLKDAFEGLTTPLERLWSPSKSALDEAFAKNSRRGRHRPSRPSR
jgi:hypothetical protein